MMFLGINFCAFGNIGGPICLNTGKEQGLVIKIIFLFLLQLKFDLLILTQQ